MREPAVANVATRSSQGCERLCRADRGARGSIWLRTPLAKLTRLRVSESLWTHLWLCGADRGAKGSQRVHAYGCPELTGVRDGACRRIRGYTELAGLSNADEGARGSIRLHVWLCRADRGVSGSMRVHTGLRRADRGARGRMWVGTPLAKLTRL
eukprot:1183179-Prorocentrum_minimum.AAC.3